MLVTYKGDDKCGVLGAHHLGISLFGGTPFSWKNSSVSFMDGMVVISMKKYHTWMETWKTGFPLSDRGAKLKVYSLIMGDTPLLWKRYSYINLSKMWWKNLVVVSPRLVRTCLTSDTRNKHWFA